MASAALAARARRLARIRRRVTAATLAAFVLAWGVIAYDGPMGAATTSASSSGATGTSSSSGATTDGSSAQSLPPVTTAQS